MNLNRQSSGDNFRIGQSIIKFKSANSRTTDDNLAPIIIYVCIAIRGRPVVALVSELAGSEHGLPNLKPGRLQ